MDVAGDQEVLGEIPAEALYGSEICERDAPQMTVSAYAADASNLEQLLRDAVRESARSSKATSHKSVPSSASRASPKSIPSPITIEPPLIQCVDPAAFMPIGGDTALLDDPEKTMYANSLQNVDWVSNWASRPEMQPPPDWLARLHHPQPRLLSPIEAAYQKAAPPARSPPLGSTLFTHALMFVLGAAT